MGGNSMSANKDVEDFVDKAIADNKVAVFSKSYCPYCHKGKNALKKAGLRDFFVVELDIEKKSECQAIQDYLRSKTGSRTVPQVFIDGKFIGGGSETEQMERSGELKKMLDVNVKA